MRQLAAVTGVFGVVLASAISVAAQQPPAAQSPAATKELVDLMTKAKVDCAVAENNQVYGGYIAALLIPGAKLTVVSARFKDTTAMTYKLYNKDCMGAYQDLSAAADAVDRVVFDDIAADGLVAKPKKDMPKDAITVDNKTTKFDSDKDALKQAKLSIEEFNKQFASADETYTKFLRLLSAQMKK